MSFNKYLKTQLPYLPEYVLFFPKLNEYRQIYFWSHLTYGPYHIKDKITGLITIGASLDECLGKLENKIETLKQTVT